MDFRHVIDEIILTLMYKGFKPLGFGTTRAVFVRGNRVYKIPLNVAHFKNNIAEAELHKRSKNGKFSWLDTDAKKRYIQLPKCRLIVLKGIPILVMEKLVPVLNGDKLEFPWKDHLEFSGDGCQIGTDKHGNLKVFDFGHMPYMSRNNLDELGTSVQALHCKYSNKFTTLSKRIKEDELYSLGFSQAIGDFLATVIEEKKELFAFT